METFMQERIAAWALWFSAGSFALYVLTALAQIAVQFKANSNSTATADAVPGVTNLLTVIKGLAEALSKASPSLVALIGSIAYLSMAALASGIFGRD